VFACLRHVLHVDVDNETAAVSCEVRHRIVSAVDPFFTLLSSSVDTAHRHIVHDVIAEFISLLSRLISTADTGFVFKVYELL